jgi:predicted permease
MAAIREWICRLWGTLRFKRSDADLQDELQSHIELAAEVAQRRGSSPADARRAARLQAGGIAQAMEALRDQRKIPGAEELVLDIRWGCRMLRKAPAFTLAVGTTLAVCLGANAALFAVVDHVLLRPLPVPAPDRIVITGNRYPKAGVDSGYSTSAADYVDRLRETDVFEEQALFKIQNQAVDKSGVPVRIPVMGVTPSFFRLAQVAPQVGRTFVDDDAEPGRETKAILSFALWSSQFGGDSSVVGRDLRVDGRPYTIVGVMPKEFALVADDVLVWTPLALTPAEKGTHYNDNWGYLARLNRAATIKEAQAEIDAINRANLDRFPQFRQVILDAGFHTVVDGLQDSLVRDVKPALRLLWGGGLFVLLIGCLNVANLVIARSRTRAKELATRIALGAGRRRLFAQLTTESIILTLSAAVGGLAIGWVALRALVALDVGDLPRGSEIAFDATTIAFTLGVGVIAGIAFGVVPLVATRMAVPINFLHDEGRQTTTGPGARRLRRALVVAQVAFALVLLVGAGLLFVSFKRVLLIDPGFRSDGVLTASVSLPSVRYRAPADARRFTDEALARLRALPAVAAAGATDTIPFGTNHTNSLMMAEGFQLGPGESIVSPARVVVSPGYLEAMGARLLAGRMFDGRDVETAPNVAIIDQTLAERFWPRTNPIGRRLYRPDDPNDLLAVTPTTMRFTVVGVIAPIKLQSLVETQLSAGAYYFPLAQQPERSLTFAIRTDMDPTTMSSAVRTAVQSVDRELPVFDVQPMERWTTKSIASRRLAMLLSLAFSAIALFLAAVGIYGMLAYLVAYRRKEMAIRLALGATGSAVFALVVQEGLVVTGIGVGLGTAGIGALRRLLQNQVFGVATADPIVLLAVTALLGSVAITACAVPAWQASRIDPVGMLTD